MRIVSVDPGKWNLPLAVWQDSVLMHCCLSRVTPGPGLLTADIARLHHSRLAQIVPLPVDAAYIEQLSLNSGRDKTRGKAISTGNALLEITSIAALVAGHFHAPIEYVPVRTWLGTATPTVTRNRVRATLSALELAILNEAIDALPHRKGKESSLAHNIYDSVGLGLYAVGRYRPGRAA